MQINRMEDRMARSWIVAATLSLAFAGGAAEAQYGGGWRVIGYKTVAFGTDVDTIYTPGQWRYRQVRLCAVNSPINVRDVDIYFANGSKRDFDFHGWLRGGQCTRVLDLPGRTRNIARIRMKYERIARGLQAPVVRVQVR